MMRILRKQGHDVTSVYDGQSAIDLLNQGDFSLVLTETGQSPEAAAGL